jgi:hypothetical protein
MSVVRLTVLGLLALAFTGGIAHERSRARCEGKDLEWSAKSTAQTINKN